MTRGELMNRYLQGMAAILAVALLAPSAPAADADGCGDLEHEDGAQIREAANRRVELRQQIVATIEGRIQRLN